MSFDPAVETARYIDSLGPEALQKAADYTIATHWMLLGGLVVTAIVTWILVRSGLLERLSSKLQNRGWALRTLLVCFAFFLLSAMFFIACNHIAENETVTTFMSTVNFIDVFFIDFQWYWSIN